jgi:LmbE family N-acetylglucosaminyl deacetylase
MTTQLKLMCILAHPDDESLGTGGILAKYAAEGIETALITATRGERGWSGAPDAYPGPEALGKIREAELRAAAAALGVRQLDILDYIDGDLDLASPDEVIAKIVAIVRRERPQVVATFGPDGAYGHPDHIAISQFATAALVAAADSSYTDARGLPPHRAAKLYYMALSADLGSAYQAVFGDLVMTIDGEERHDVVWPDWAITTSVDATAHWQTVWRAVACHRTQLPNYEALAGLSAERHQRLWGRQMYYRAFSLVNGGRQKEDDLFAGLR